MYYYILIYCLRCSHTLSGAAMISNVVAGLLNDFHVYDPANIRWTDLSAAASGSPPSPRDGHGFALLGGKLYVHGGYGTSCARPAIRFDHYGQ